jgi:predicted  nucleic acid-binding Zn-ribbon protein
VYTDRDTCVEKLHILREKRALEEHEIMRNNKRIASLEDKIEALQEEIDATTVQIEDTVTLLAEMKADRK